MAPVGTVRWTGLFDLQVNGFAGVDFNDPATTADDLARATDAMQRTGVTAFLPTLISSTFEGFARCARTIVHSGIPAIAGLHMEGPYLSPLDGPRGAHDAEVIREASLDDFERRQDAADGQIRLVTLAPEAPGALSLIPPLVERGVVVAIGHTSADAATLHEAVTRGARLSTHLGNGCAAVMPRHPNLLWDQLAEDRLTATFIADGHHLSPSTLKAMVRAKGAARSVLVTDATAAAAADPGDYTIGTVRIRLSDEGRVTTAAGTRLAGSALTLDAAVGNVVRAAGVTLEDALAMASQQATATVGLSPRGTLEADWDARSCRLRVLSVRA